MEVMKCEDCGSFYEPPMSTCLECGGNNLSQTTVSDTGKIEVWTTIHVPPSSHSGEQPYHIAIIRMEEGPKLTARVKAESEKIEFGEEVELVSDDDFKLFRTV